MGQPVFSSHSWAVPLCTAMPPPTLIFSEPQFTVEKSGWLAIALNRVLTAGKLWKRSVDKALSRAGMSRALGIKMLQPPMCRASSMFALKAKM